MKINVVIDSEYRQQINAVWLRKITRRVLAAEHAGRNAEMGLVITGDATIHRLNRDYLEEDRPTDVLSFPMLESIADNTLFINPPDGDLHLGEVIISYPQAVKQALEHSHSPQLEIAILLIHGVLHLLAYDHDIPEREQVMKQRETAILQLVKEWIQ